MTSFVEGEGIAAGAVSARVAALGETTLRGMNMARITAVAAGLLALGVAISGGVLLAGRAPGAPGPGAAKQAEGGGQVGRTKPGPDEQGGPNPTITLVGQTAYDPDAQARVRARFAGMIEAVRVEAGRQVAEGDPLVDLFSGELSTAKSDYEGADAEWHRDKAARVAEKESRQAYQFARDRLKIFGLSEREIDAIKEEADSARPRMTVRAPKGGLVVELKAVPGAKIAGGDAIATIASTDHLWVWCNVPERDVLRLRKGQACEVELAASGEKVRGEVRSIGMEVNPETATTRVGIAIPNPGDRYLAGMSVTTRIAVEEPKTGREDKPRD